MNVHGEQDDWRRKIIYMVHTICDKIEKTYIARVRDNNTR